HTQLPRRVEQSFSEWSPAEVSGSGLASPVSEPKVDNRSVRLAFIACVLVPTFFAFVYFALFASNQYVAEFRFTVKDASSSVSGQQSLLSILSSSHSSPFNNYVVTDYLSSRQVIDELRNKIGLVSIYSKVNIDWLSRFNPTRPVEKFAAYW